MSYTIGAPGKRSRIGPASSAVIRSAPTAPRPVVDEDRAVGVAVERDAERARPLPHGALQVDEVLRLERVGLVVREAAVEAEEERHEVDVELLEQRAVERRHAVGDVHGDLQARLRPADEGEDVRAVGRRDVRGFQSACAPGRRRRVRAHQLLEPRDAGLAADRDRVPARELEAVVARRVVAGGDLDAAGGPEVPDGEVVHRRRREADVDDGEAGGPQAVGERGRERRRGGPHVAADDHLPAAREVLRIEDAAEVVADGECQLLVDLVGVDAAHVVRLEDAAHR